MQTLATYERGARDKYEVWLYEDGWGERICLYLEEGRLVII